MCKRLHVVLPNHILPTSTYFNMPAWASPWPQLTHWISIRVSSHATARNIMHISYFRFCFDITLWKQWTGVLFFIFLKIGDLIMRPAVIYYSKSPTRTLVRFHFGSPFPSKAVVHALLLCSLTFNEPLKWLTQLPKSSTIFPVRGGSLCPFSLISRVLWPRLQPS